MKYLLFAGEDYEERGGWRDLVGESATLEAAQALFAQVDDRHWAHVVVVNDDLTCRIVAVYTHAYQNAYQDVRAGWYYEGEPGFQAQMDYTYLFNNVESAS